MCSVKRDFQQLDTFLQQQKCARSVVELILDADDEHTAEQSYGYTLCTSAHCLLQFSDSIAVPGVRHLLSGRHIFQRNLILHVTWIQWCVEELADCKQSFLNGRLYVADLGDESGPKACVEYSSHNGSSFTEEEMEGTLFSWIAKSCAWLQDCESGSRLSLPSSRPRAFVEHELETLYGGSLASTSSAGTFLTKRARLITSDLSNSVVCEQSRAQRRHHSNNGTDLHVLHPDRDLSECFRRFFSFSGSLTKTCGVRVMRAIGDLPA